MDISLNITMSPGLIRFGFSFFEVSNISKRKDEIITEENAISVPKSDEEEKGFYGRLLDRINPLDEE